MLHDGDCVRVSFRSALHELRRVYAHEDAGPVVDAYDKARRRSRMFRVLTAVLECFYPVRGFLTHAAELLDRAIAEEGLHAGCRRALDTLSFAWECRVPEAHEQTLRSAPIIFYGNHPSLLTPFLLAAGVDREDLRFLSTSYVRRLIPSFSRFCLRLEVPLTRLWTEWKRGGFRRVLAYRLLSLLQAVPPSGDAKAVNRRALGDAATALRNGGSVMIVPSGGGKRERHWFPGIGILARSLIEQPGSAPIYIVPVREENCSNKQVYAALMRGPIARAKRRFLYSRPVLLTFASPTPLIDVVGGASTVDGAVAALREHYERAFRIGR
jgi:hypothetical protein